MRAFLQSFVYASAGIRAGFAGRNMRLHGLSAAVVIAVSWFTGLSAAEWAVVLMLIGGMIALELMNTAVECAVDLVTLDFHPLAKKAKDLAAGAVLVYAVISAVIAAIIFLPKWF